MLHEFEYIDDYVYSPSLDSALFDEYEGCQCTITCSVANGCTCLKYNSAYTADGILNDQTSSVLRTAPAHNAVTPLCKVYGQFTETLLAESLLTETVLPKRHFTEKTVYRKTVLPKRHLAEIHLTETDSWPKRIIDRNHNTPKQRFHRNSISPKQ
uniref:Apple domain-containing protein n=1 Tax=Panagrellus redivivus TaxID=6233 RepID=A0A7E4V4D1_PANRE